MDQLAEPLIAIVAGSTIGIGLAELGKRLRSRMVRVKAR
ncbi:MAG: hypothetical protein QOG54_2140 [Actinomycetota bacterium]|jgi:hypothetical protein|nr:hypothetical protein [Actinomycetota bacterium]